MILPQFFDSPFQVRLSFHKIIERLEQMQANGQGLYGVNIHELLNKVAKHPELRDGITDISQVKDDGPLISQLLTELFPAALTKNEIKAISIPYQGLMFNYSERFRNILHDAGPGFDINIRDFDEHQFYVSCCCIILNMLYGQVLDFSKPLFYDIPTAAGIIKHYRIIYNADFMEVIPTESSTVLSPADIKLLLDNYDDLALWKEKFPAHGWIMKGFAIMTLVDVTVQNAVSILKDNLLGNLAPSDLQHSLETIFSSIFQVSGIKVGFTLYDQASGKLNSSPFGQKIQSFLLAGKIELDEKDIMCKGSYQNLIKEHNYFAIADTADLITKDRESFLGKSFDKQGIKSFILAPAVKNDTLFGFLELVSDKTGIFNSVNANKLDVVMPYLVDSIDRKFSEFQNAIQAVIQNNYTTLHPSVNWKFEREARNYIANTQSGLDYHLKQIRFKNVYPFYGQVDIQNSSLTRNLSVKNDLQLQIDELLLLIEKLNKSKVVDLAEQKAGTLKDFSDGLTEGIRADTEQEIQHYLDTEIHPLLRSAGGLSADDVNDIEDYFRQTEALTGDFYINRRNYEQTLVLVNNKLADILDRRQTEIQKFHPHYYERFKTDGVEHNLYIGSTIAPELDFTGKDLKRLRLWQLLVTAEMELEQERLKQVLPYHLGVTTLLLVYSTPIDIRFRMDEKHFDIDGTYSARYEVVKKRIDKAHIKNTQERITQQGTMTIVYTKAEEAAEYREYLAILQSTGILDSIEEFEVEELQGIAGLKGLRAKIIYNQELLLHFDFIYDQLYEQLN